MANEIVKQEATTPAVMQRQPTFKEYLELRGAPLKAVLPKHLSLERIQKVAILAYNKQPALQQCSLESVFRSVMESGELGLEPGGPMPLADLVPCGGECQLRIRYRGLIELAKRTGEVASIEARVVHQNDFFDLEEGFDPVLRHRPCLDGDPGPLRAVYAIARLRDGTRQYDWMTRAEVDRIKALAPGGSKSASTWNLHYDEMARKTVVKRLCKYLSLSPEKSELLGRAIEADEPREPVAFEHPQMPSGGLLSKLQAQLPAPTPEPKIVIQDEEAPAET